MNTTELSRKDAQHHIHPVTNPVTLREKGPDMVTRAEGIYLYTEDGRQLMDIGSGLANVNIGYGNERICQTAYRTMQRLSYGHAFAGRSNPWVAELSAKLAEITPASFQHFFFASTGSDAIESAIKMALRYWRLRGKPEKRAIIARQYSYHGNTLFAASLTGIEFYHTQFGLPLSEMIHHAQAPYWYRYGEGRDKEAFGLAVANALEQQILAIGPENIAAFVGDPIQTGGGCIIPPASYWPEVQEICHKYDILIIADEVISGFGKTGQWFGFENFGFEPDLIAMAKGLSSGYFPISAVAVGGKVSNVLQKTDETFAHVFTNCGHPVGAAVALENIAIIEEEGLIQQVREETGPYFAERLQDFLACPCVGEVRSLGIIGAIELDITRMNPAATAEDNNALSEKIVSLAWDKGLAMRGSGLILPMIMTKAQIDEAMDRLKASIVEALA